MEFDSRVEVVLKQDKDNNKQDEPSSGSEISLRELIEVLLRRKTIIIALTIIAVGLTLAYSVFSNPYRNYDGVAKVVLQFNYDGIEKGLDPTGKRFDINKIKSPDVLSRVVENLDLQKDDFTSSDLRDLFEIKPVVPGNIVDLTLRKIEALTVEDVAIFRGEDYVYYPNKFVISFYIPKDKNITKNQGEHILRETLEAYMEFFYDTYSDRAVLNTAFEIIDYDEYDYPEAVYIMRKQIGLIQNYLSGKMQAQPDFRSGATGLTFGDILEGISVIMDLDLNYLNSIIRTYTVTKDAERLIAIWQNRARNYELDISKLQSEMHHTRDTLEKYEKEKILFMMGSKDYDSEPLEIERHSKIYDDLLMRILNSGVKANTLLHDTEYLKQEIELFSRAKSSVNNRDDDDDDDEEAVEVTITPAQREEAEKEVIQLIEGTSNKMLHWLELTNQTVDDYIENKYFDRAIMPLTPVQSSGIPIRRLRLNLAVGLVLGLMLGIFWAFLKEYWTKSGVARTKAEMGKSVAGN